jgi:hypothetical protein
MKLNLGAFACALHASSLTRSHHAVCVAAPDLLELLGCSLVMVGVASDAHHAESGLTQLFASTKARTALAS